MKTDAYTDIQNIGTERIPITHYLGLVKKVALHLRSRVPAYIELDDMIQLGTLGLIEAESKYDISLGVSFEHFAKMRIKGAIIDEARRLSDVSRLAIQNSKIHSQTFHELSNQLGHAPTNREMASHLDMDIATFEDQRTHADNLNTLELDALYEDSTFEIAGQSPEVFDEVAEEGLKTIVAEAIAQLDQRKQLILKLYYMEEMNLREIGSIIGVNESRISQILSATVKELRPLLASSYQSGD